MMPMEPLSQLWGGWVRKKGFELEVNGGLGLIRMVLSIPSAFCTRENRKEHTPFVEAASKASIPGPT
jgi:hypothetical protein